MSKFCALLTLITLSLAGAASAGSPCVAFDISWNLLAFGFNGKDYNASTQDTWASGSATEITTSGRPPFNGSKTRCYLSQYVNAIYVLGADASSASSIYIFDATAKSWSTQAVTAGTFDPSSFDAILDHDTNVFYALSHGKIFSLDMGSLKAASSTAVVWRYAQDSGFGANYQSVMALARNHIHFINVPGVAAGSAKIFVIHFSFMQSEPQHYGKFPASHGQTTSFFMDSGAQQEFAFVPDDGSATYVLNAKAGLFPIYPPQFSLCSPPRQTNTTQTLKGPPAKDSLATYFASTKSLVQLSSSGSVSYIPYSPGSSANSASWSAVSKLPVAKPFSRSTTTRDHSGRMVKRSSHH